MTKNEILNLDIEDINRMTQKELRSVVQTLATIGNKRVKNLQKNIDKIGYSRALDTWEVFGSEKFSTKGKNRNQLLSEFMRVRGFVNAKTSTVAGAKSVKKEMLTRITNGRKTSMKQKDIDNYWKAYNRLKETNPQLFYSNEYDSTKTQILLHEVMSETKFDVDKTLSRMDSIIEQEYLQKEKDDLLYESMRFSNPL